MNEIKNITANTGEPVTEQAPTVDASSTPTVTDLPNGYLADGFLETASTSKPFLRTAYVGVFAQQIAAVLQPMSPSAFQAAFLRDAKKHLRRGVPYEAQAACAAALLPQAIKLTAKHKAPPVLVDIITAVVGAVHDSATFEAMYRHLDAVYAFIMLQTQQKGGDT